MLSPAAATVVVAGTSAAGKTALAVRIGERLAIPHVEIDALFHHPAWTSRAASQPTWTPPEPSESGR